MEQIAPKIIISRWFPPGGFVAITIYKWVIVKKRFLDKYKDTNRWIELLNHEKIHLAQIQELGVLKFYWLYLKYFLKLWLGSSRGWYAAYEDNPLEQEANDHEHDATYLSNRTPFEWEKYKT